MSYLSKKNADQLFIILCETYHEKIIKYLFYSVNDIEDAKDLTQEVFTIVYNRMDEIENHVNQAGFIYQTAKYVAANFKRKASKKASSEYPLLEDSQTAFSFSDAYDEMQYLHDVQIDESCYTNNVLTSLSEDKRELYKLHYIEKRPYKEIAKNLGVTEVNLRMKYVRLRREIKQIIKSIAEENFS